MPSGNSQRTIAQTELKLELSDGRQLGYAVYGAEKGRPLLYFHGGLSSRLDIAFGADELARQNITMYAPDRPGIGLSDRKPKRTLLDWAADVGQFMTILKIQPAPILAWSVSGPAAFACAYALPERITRVATVGSAPSLEYANAIQDLGLWIDRVLLTWPDLLDPFIAAGLQITGKLPPALLKKVLEDDVVSQADLNIIKPLSAADATRYLTESVRQGGAGNVDDYKMIKKPWGFKLEDIKTNVHLWQGEDDHLCSPSISRWLSTRLPNSKLIMVPNQAHFMLRIILPDVLSALMD